VIVVNKVDLIDTDQQKLLKDIVQALAPRAKVISTSFGKVPLAATLGTLLLHVSISHHQAEVCKLLYTANTMCTKLGILACTALFLCMTVQLTNSQCCV
jgi:G3E family GTPase